MRKISIDELMEFYVDTINKCGTYLLKEDDKTIGYCIFEEFDIGATTFLHKDNLNILKDEGFISDKIMKKSIELRKLFFKLQSSNEWGLEYVRYSHDWRKLLELSDEIRNMIANL